MTRDYWEIMNIHSSLALVPSDGLLVLTLEAPTAKSTNQAPHESISESSTFQRSS